MNDPRNRPFTRLAARMLGTEDSLLKGHCPTCRKPITEFRNEISKREFSISGMCQSCQDSVFGKD